MLNSESLNNVLENKIISRQDIMGIYQNAVEDSSELFSVAQNLRKRFKKDSVTFSKKAFFTLSISAKILVLTAHTKLNQMRKNYL